MKVKQLKEILSGMDENYDVVVTDLDDKGIAISDVWVEDPVVHPVVHIETRQVFPEEWYDESGDEISQGYKRSMQAEDGDYFFCDEEFFDGEVQLHLHVEDGIAQGDGAVIVYPQVCTLTREQIREMDEYLGGRIHDSGVVCPSDALLVYGKISRFNGIMDTTNGHNPDLVRTINSWWIERREAFEPILKALYERDIEEITDHYAFLFDQWKEWPEYNQGCETNNWSNYNKRALKDLQEYWEFHAENYLQHIADDGDLETILNFIRNR